MKETLLSFGEATAAMEEGKIVARQGWNGNGMWLFMQIANVVPKDFIPNFKSLPDAVKQKLITLDTDVVFNKSITIMTAQKSLQPGWHPSQPDIFATDWYIVE